MLEGGWWTPKTKGHHQKLIMAFVSAKSSFGNIGLLHMGLVISRMEIKFGKTLSTFKFIQNIVNNWNGELVLDNYSIENMKFKTYVPSTFFFNSYHDHWG
jgi:hypothetical protein